MFCPSPYSGLLWLLLTSGRLSTESFLSLCCPVAFGPSGYLAPFLGFVFAQFSLAPLTAISQTSPDKNVNFDCTTASFTVSLEPLGFVVLCQLTQESRPSMTFLFVGSQLCRWLPSDTPSRGCPCLKLVVIASWIVESIIWTLVLLQGTFTPLIHARAGRTQAPPADAPKARAAEACR
jgi:hypothetical protein